MHTVYILYSPLIDKYYIGSTTGDLDLRLSKHNSGYYDKSFTAQGRPWEKYLVIDCSGEKQARKIEMHIKSMKSKKYIRNLKAYPEMVERLKARFPEVGLESR